LVWKKKRSYPKKETRLYGLGKESKDSLLLPEKKKKGGSSALNFSRGKSREKAGGV